MTMYLTLWEIWEYTEEDRSTAVSSASDLLIREIVGVTW